MPELNMKDRNHYFKSCYRYLLLLPIFLMSFCNSSFEKKSDPRLVPMRKFKSYDLFSLKGIDPITDSDNEFPFVLIQEDSGEVTIEHRLSAATTDRVTFFKEGEMLWQKVDLKRGKMSLTNYEYHTKDSIIIMVYDNSEKYGVLNSIGIFKNDEIVFTIFNPYTELFTKHGYQNALLMLNTQKEWVKETIKFSLKENRVLVNYGRQNFQDSSNYNELIVLANSQRHNLNWWLIYKWIRFDKTFMLFEEKINSLK